MTILPSNQSKKKATKERQHGVLKSKASGSRGIGSCRFSNSNSNYNASGKTKAPSPSWSNQDGEWLKKLISSVNKRRSSAVGRHYASQYSSPSPPLGSSTHNSDDEYGTYGISIDPKQEGCFAEALKKRFGWEIKEMEGDGACMFRAVADQIFGSEDMHSEVRRLCIDYMAKNRDHFSQFITEDFDKYIARKRNDNVHGNHSELQAISEIFLRPIEIYEYDIEPKNIFSPHIEPTSSLKPNPPIRLSYHGSIHYNSVVDPFAPSVGVGLGLPDNSTQSENEEILKETVQMSDEHHIDETVLKESLALSDYEQTEFELNEQVAAKSYFEHLNDMMPLKKNPQNGGKNSPIDNEPSCSRMSPRGQRTFEEILYNRNLGEWAVAAKSDVEEQALINRILMVSQQEFDDSLEKS